MDLIDDFQTELGYKFRDPRLIRVALTHPSVSIEELGDGHNQRLEFLGDAVLQLILTHELYRRFPEFGEGDMTKARAQLVNRKSLADQGARLELGRFIRMSRGEEANGGRTRASTLADAFEALLGALYLDSSYEVTRVFVVKQFEKSLDALKTAPNLGNPKGLLQELLQATTSEAPQYREISTSGPDHDRNFECAVYSHGVELARAWGKSKKDAEINAAAIALADLKSGKRKAPALEPADEEPK